MGYKHASLVTFTTVQNKFYGHKTCLADNLYCINEEKKCIFDFIFSPKLRL